MHAAQPRLPLHHLAGQMRTNRTHGQFNGLLYANLLYLRFDVKFSPFPTCPVLLGTGPGVVPGARAGASGRSLAAERCADACRYPGSIALS